MFRHPALLTSLSLLAASLSLPLHADVSLHITDNQGGESRVLVRSGICRIEAANAPGVTLVNTADGSVTYIDKTRGEYSTLERNEIQARLNRLDSVRKSIAPHMDSLRDGMQVLPAEQRAILEQFIAGADAPAAGIPATLSADGGVQQIAGLSCRHYRILSGARQTGEACLLEKAGGAISAGDFNTLNTAMKLVRELAAQSGGLLAAAGSKTVLLQKDGIPLYMRDSASGESYRLTKTGNTPLDEKLFTGYLDYRKVAAPALPGLF